uniref:hypothetical protein n=1 Tax=Endozoicomonas sp. SESOKO1 TaxID=2828742 RepID=UPI0021473C1E
PTSNPAISSATSGRYSDAGIGAGEMAGQIEHLAVTDSWVETRGGGANSGIGGGKITGDIGHLTVLSSNVSTLQTGADAGIGGGEVAGDIRNMTVVNSRVTTKGIVAHAGIGGGQVGNRRSLSLGGIGGGKLIKGSVNDLIALDSHVRTEGRSAHAGIGGGVVNDEVRGVSAINCSVSAENGKAGIGAGLYNSGSAADIRSLNSKVDGKPQNFRTEDSYELCRSADSRFVTDDCQLTPDSLTEDHWNWNCSATSIVSAPVRSAAHRPFPQPASASVNNTVMADTTSQQPAMTSPNETAMANTARRLSSHTLSTPAPRNDMAMANTTTLLPSQILAAPAPLNQMVMSNTTITGHTMATPLPSINATITTTPPLAAAAMATPAAVMETVVTLPEASMTFAGMPPATALPTTPPPLAETLNIGIVLGVSFGTAFTILAGIGLCALYQYCHRRNEARKQAEPEGSRPITDSTRV